MLRPALRYQPSKKVVLEDWEPEPKSWALNSETSLYPAVIAKVQVDDQAARGVERHEKYHSAHWLDHLMLRPW